MAKVREPTLWHGRIGALVAVVGGLFAMLTASDFGTNDAGIDLNPFLVISLIAVAGIALLTMTGHHFDQVHPTAGFFEAFIRLLAPVIVLAIASAWLMNAGIFARRQNAFVPVGILMTLAVVIVRWLFGRQLPTQAALGGATTTTAAPASPAATAPAAAVLPMFDGPPQWPSAPPTEPARPAASKAAAAVPAATPPARQQDIAPAPSRSSRRPKSHRITSGLITLGWIPLGGLVWFAANWCPADGTGDAIYITSTIFVFTQLIVNPLAGWFLDRRYGNKGGAMLAVGRSLLFAVALMFAAGMFLSLFVPDGGASNYCG